MHEHALEVFLTPLCFLLPLYTLSPLLWRHASMIYTENEFRTFIFLSLVFKYKGNSMYNMPKVQFKSVWVMLQRSWVTCMWLKYSTTVAVEVRDLHAAHRESQHGIYTEHQYQALYKWRGGGRKNRGANINLKWIFMLLKGLGRVDILTLLAFLHCLVKEKWIKITNE